MFFDVFELGIDTPLLLQRESTFYMWSGRLKRFPAAEPKIFVARDFRLNRRKKSAERFAILVEVLVP